MNLLKSTLSAIALGSAVLAGPALAQEKPTVGIAMPTKSSARWIDDGNNIVKVLKERGYNTDLQYAEDDIPNQLSQIENMVTKGAKVLVIASIDGTTLSDVLKQAKDKGITVIAYDRLIRDTPNVDYYATFDNFQVGVLPAQSIERDKDGIKFDMDGGIHIRVHADVILKRRHESRESDLDRIEAGTKPLANKDSVFVGEQLYGPAADEFRRQPDAGAHLRVAGRIGHNTRQFAKIMRREGRSSGEEKPEKNKGCSAQ